MCVRVSTVHSQHAVMDDFYQSYVPKYIHAVRIHTYNGNFCLENIVNLTAPDALYTSLASQRMSLSQGN